MLDNAMKSDPFSVETNTESSSVGGEIAGSALDRRLHEGLCSDFNGTSGAQTNPLLFAALLLGRSGDVEDRRDTDTGGDSPRHHPDRPDQQFPAGHPIRSGLRIRAGARAGTVQICNRKFGVIGHQRPPSRILDENPPDLYSSAGAGKSAHLGIPWALAGTTNFVGVGTTYTFSL